MANYLINNPSNTFTMVWRLPIQWHGDGDPTHLTPVSLCGRCWQRAGVFEDFVKFNDVGGKG